MLRRALTFTAALGLLALVAMPAAARNVNADNLYTVTVLQSSIPGASTAATPDTDLVNGWGIAASGSSPWWVADNGTDKSTLYNAAGTKLGLVVSVPGAPTGIVFNAAVGDFLVGATKASFIFDTEDGTILGWNGGTVATAEFAATDGASYKGLATGAATTDGTTANYLYAADFHNAKVDVIDRSWSKVTWDGAFVDPGLPDGFAPFGIQNLNGTIFVTYAMQDEEAGDEVAGEGLGYVSAFATDGTFLGRVASRGDLNAPWGLAWAPAGFGKFSGDLLVGNFGDGRINAFAAGEDGWEARGVVKGTDHRPISIDGLWGIGFGNGGQAGPLNVLYFAAGPNDEEDGAFGSIMAP